MVNTRLVKLIFRDVYFCYCFRSIGGGARTPPPPHSSVSEIDWVFFVTTLTNIEITFIKNVYILLSSHHHRIIIIISSSMSSNSSNSSSSNRRSSSNSSSSSSSKHNSGSGRTKQTRLKK